MKQSETYKAKTGADATYKARGATWHTLRYVTWLEENNSRLLAALKDLMVIVANSGGVYGYHLNGNYASWGEFEEELSCAEQVIKGAGARE